MNDRVEHSRLLKHVFFAASIAFSVLVSSPVVHASLRIIQVKKDDAVSKDLGLAVVVASDEHFPESPIVTVTARSDSPLRTMFGSTLRVGEEQHLRTTSLLLDVPVEFTRPYRTAALRLTFRLEKRMLRSATLHLRTGTPASEVLYKIRLAQYIEAETKK